MKVRLYGPTIGYGSFCRVAAGMKEGLEACDLLAGFVPTDTIEEQVKYAGHDAEVGVYVGPAPGASIMRSMGWHKERLCLFPPNSTWVPTTTLEALTTPTEKEQAYLTGFIAPSSWAKETLSKHTKAPVELWHHGASSEFQFAGDRARRRENAKKSFAALHLASTRNQRKGTRELVETWGRLVAQECLGPAPILNLVVDGGSEAELEPYVRKHLLTPEQLATIRLFGRQELGIAEAASMYSAHHVTIQPSRGEGFGLSVLESRLCETPVIATNCTGHIDQLVFSNGVIPVCCEGLQPIDDGPEALAPIIDLESLAFTIVSMYENWDKYEQAAIDYRSQLAENWNWKATTARWWQSRKER
jgi:glycosyltransferase involved in cell wall biosynthesis